MLLLGHRQAFAWIDEWIDMSYEEVRDYEALLQKQTNSLLQKKTEPLEPPSPIDLNVENSTPTTSSSTPNTPKSPTRRGYFNWF